MSTDALTPDGDGFVVVDRLGAPRPAQTLDAIRICVLGLPETARQRLQAAGATELVDDPAEADSADLVVVSTRLPRAQLEALVGRVRATLPAPIVALAHTGGETLAVEVMRLGGAGVLAEGNEAALGSFLSGEPFDASLVDTYERQISHTVGSDDAALSRDDVTGFPRASAFEQRLVTYAQAGDVPRIAFLRVLNLEQAARRLSPAGVALVRRRLALRYRQTIAGQPVEMFALGPYDLALLSDALSPHQAEALARRLATATSAYTPAGKPLALAVGHAGPEVTTELTTLREMAQRALTVAATQRSSSVVSAEALALGVSSTTELEAALRLVDFVERSDERRVGHGGRVGAAAEEILAELGYDASARARIRLAGCLHEIGKVGLPAEIFGDGEDLTADARWAYRSYPVRGAGYLNVSAGSEVADSVRAHQERWDGSGFPDGLSGEQIPLPARVLAVADRFDTLRTAGAGLSVADALAVLEQEAGTRLDPDVVRAAVPVLTRPELETDRATG